MKKQNNIREGFVSNHGITLYFREIGTGQPIFIVHGGPDFDHKYLLPEMDLLADGYRLIYYDQRGRGNSFRELNHEEILIEKYIEDIDCLRKFFKYEKIAIMGHSWGAHLAMHYAVNQTENVSHLILLNTAPASYEDSVLMMQNIRKRRAPYEAELKAISETEEFKQGEPRLVDKFHKIVYGTTFKNPVLAERLNLNFTKENIISGRRIEDLLLTQVYSKEGFTLIPKLKNLSIPTIIIYGDYDFIPFECSKHIADAISGSQLVTLRGSGHFSYIDSQAEFRSALDNFLTLPGKYQG